MMTDATDREVRYATDEVIARVEAVCFTLDESPRFERGYARSRNARLGDTAHQVVVGTLDPEQILASSSRPTACRS